jgi:hypothetical protein
MDTIKRKKGASSKTGGGAPMSMTAMSIYLGCRELIAGSSGTDSSSPALPSEKP